MSIATSRRSSWREHQIRVFDVDVEGCATLVVPFIRATRVYGWSVSITAVSETGRPLGEQVARRIVEADGSFRVAVTSVAPPEGMLIVVGVEAQLGRPDDELVACPCCGDPTPLLWPPRQQHPEWVCSTCGASGAVRVSGPPPRTPNLYEIADS